MASCNSWQYLVTILAKIFPRSWQDLAKILLRYPWRVDPGSPVLINHGKRFSFTLLMNSRREKRTNFTLHDASTEVKFLKENYVMWP